MTRQRLAPSAERIATSFCRDKRSRQQQARDVRARDQQYKSNRAEQHQQNRPHVPDHFFLKRNDSRFYARMRIVELLLDATRDQIQLRLRFVGGLTGLESPDQIRAVHEATRQLVLRRLIRQEKICRPQCKLKTRRQHADHGVAFAIDRERATDDARIAAESALPQCRKSAPLPLDHPDCLHRSETFVREQDRRRARKRNSHSRAARSDFPDRRSH